MFHIVLDTFGFIQARIGKIHVSGPGYKIHSAIVYALNGQNTVFDMDLFSGDVTAQLFRYHSNRSVI